MEVSLSTHCSIERVHHLVAMAEASDMFISVALHIKENIGVSFALVQRLRQCSRAVERLVDFHFVFSDGMDEYADYSSFGKTKLSLTSIIKQSQQVFSRFSCSEVLSEGRDLIFHSEKYQDASNTGLWPPNNMLRNVAMRHVRTSHVMMIEAAIVPCASLGAIYESALNASRTNHTAEFLMVLILPGTAKLCFATKLNSKHCSL
jgi:hypothetical protein